MIQHLHQLPAPEDQCLQRQRLLGLGLDALRALAIAPKCTSALSIEPVRLGQCPPVALAKWRTWRAFTMPNAIHAALNCTASARSSPPGRLHHYQHWRFGTKAFYKYQVTKKQEGIDGVWRRGLMVDQCRHRLTLTLRVPSPPHPLSCLKSRTDRMLTHANSFPVGISEAAALREVRRSTGSSGGRLVPRAN